MRAHRAARFTVVAALALALLAGPVVGAAPANAATPEPEEAGTAQLSVSAGVHGVVQPGQPVTATIVIDNGGEEAITAGRVAVEINKTPLDATSLTTWLDSGAAAGTFTPLGTDESLPVAASETTTTFVSTSAAPLAGLAPGVYPLRATLTADDAADTLTASSVLILDGASTPQVTVLVPIIATPTDEGLLTAEELTALTAPDGALTSQLDGVAGTSAVLAIDPLIPAAIRALGSAAPADAVAWLARLESLSNERFALQPGDADATVQARAGLTELLAPLPLTPFLTPENFAETAATPGPTPTPSPTPTEPELPGYEELTAIRGAESGILWPVGDVQTTDLSAFDAFLDTDVTTVLPSTSLAATTNALADIDGHRALVVDAAASAALSTAAATADDLVREDEIAEAMAQLSFAGAQESLLVGLDRRESRNADALRETILSVSAIGQPTTLSDMRATTPASGTLTGEATGERAASLTDLLGDEDRLRSFATILDDPLVLLSPERLSLLRLIGVGATETFAADAAAHRTQTTGTLNAVGVQQPSPIQLFTAAAPLPVWIHNELPWPVNVTLSAHPSDARLDITPLTPAVALPASNTRVKVPVEARVGSGVLDVRFGLTSPTGVHIGTDQTATVTVRAEWEGIGLGILGGVIGLLLVLGIVRTVVRRRRSRGADAAAGAPASE